MEETQDGIPKLGTTTFLGGQLWAMVWGLCGLRARRIGGYWLQGYGGQWLHGYWLCGH